MAGGAKSFSQVVRSQFMYKKQSKYYPMNSEVTILMRIIVDPFFDGSGVAFVFLTERYQMNKREAVRQPNT